MTVNCHLPIQDDWKYTGQGQSRFPVINVLSCCMGGHHREIHRWRYDFSWRSREEQCKLHEDDPRAFFRQDVSRPVTDLRPRYSTSFLQKARGSSLGSSFLMALFLSISATKVGSPAMYLTIMSAQAARNAAAIAPGKRLIMRIAPLALITGVA